MPVDTALTRVQSISLQEPRFIGPSVICTRTGEPVTSEWGGEENIISAAARQMDELILEGLISRARANSRLGENGRSYPSFIS